MLQYPLLSCFFVVFLVVVHRLVVLFWQNGLHVNVPFVVHDWLTAKSLGFHGLVELTIVIHSIVSILKELDLISYPV